MSLQALLLDVLRLLHLLRCTRHVLVLCIT